MRMPIEAGDRFRQQDHSGGIWRVVEVYDNCLGQTHALIEREDDSASRKSIGLSALRDHKRFRKCAAVDEANLSDHATSQEKGPGQ